VKSGLSDVCRKLTNLTIFCRTQKIVWDRFNKNFSALITYPATHKINGRFFGIDTIIEFHFKKE
jgi:hypothetical protein